MRGKFIVIYGINNLGKTTQAKKIVEYILQKGLRADYVKYPVYDMKPSGPFLDKVLRSLRQEIPEEEFQMWMTVNRFQFQPLLKRKLNQGIYIVAEDYVGTGLAWGSVKGANYDWLKAMNSLLLKEDIAILLDGERFVAGQEKVHIHETDPRLIDMVRRKHLEIGKELGWFVVNANQAREKVFNDILTVLREHGIIDFL